MTPRSYFIEQAAGTAEIALEDALQSSFNGKLPTVLQKAYRHADAIGTFNKDVASGLRLRLSAYLGRAIAKFSKLPPTGDKVEKYTEFLDSFESWGGIKPFINSTLVDFTRIDVLHIHDSLVFEIVRETAERHLGKSETLATAVDYAKLASSRGQMELMRRALNSLVEAHFAFVAQQIENDHDVDTSPAELESLRSLVYDTTAQNTIEKQFPKLFPGPSNPALREPEPIGLGGPFGLSE